MVRNIGRWRLAPVICVPGYSVGEDAQSGPLELQASEPVLCNWLSGVALRSGDAAGELVRPGQHAIRRGIEIRRAYMRVNPSWAACCPERLGDPARLQASLSVLGSLLSGEAWRSGEPASE